MAALSDRTAHEWLCLHNATKAELTKLEQEIAQRAPLLENKHLHDNNAVALRAQIPDLKRKVLAALIFESNRDRMLAERELAAIRSEVVAARALLAGDQMELTTRQIAAANAVLDREATIRERISDCAARAHAAPYLVDAL